MNLFNRFLKDNCLVGPVIEVPPTGTPFIHTYMFGVNKIGLQLLLSNQDIFNNQEKKDNIIAERRITSVILNAGKGIKSLLRKYKHINWQHSYESYRRKLPTCPEVPFNYDSIDLHPFEIIFVKNIRIVHAYRSIEHAGISSSLSTILDNYTKWAS